MRLATLRVALLLLAIAAAGTSRGAPVSDAPPAASASLAAYLPQWQDLKRRSEGAALAKASRPVREQLRSGGAPPADLATAMTWLADAVQGQGRYPEAETLYREA